MSHGVISMTPNKNNNTCVFVLDVACFPEEENDIYFTEDVYKQLRQGLVKARLNYTVSDLKATIIEEDKKKNTVTVQISAV